MNIKNIIIKVLILVDVNYEDKKVAEYKNEALFFVFETLNRVFILSQCLLFYCKSYNNNEFIHHQI